MKPLIAQLILGAALVAPASLFAQAYSEGIITIPGAVLPPSAYGIDDNDQVVGVFEDSQGYGHGFLLSSGVVAQIDWPGAVVTAPLAINSVAGIASYYEDSTGQFDMLDAKRRLQTIKGSRDLSVLGINASGTFVAYNGNTSFINVNGAYTKLNPSVCQGLTPPSAVYVAGINSNNDYVGYCWDQNATYIGFAHVGGVDQVVSVFGSPTFPTGINDSGTIAGHFTDGSGVYHGFVLSGGNAAQFDFVTSTLGTKINGINNHGSLVGAALLDRNVGWVPFFAFAN